MIEQIQQKNGDKGNKLKEPAVIVVPQAISTDTLDFIATHSGQSVTLPSKTDVAAPKARAKSKKEPELAWQVTPSTDLSKLGNHYLMLSKIRLTSKEMVILSWKKSNGFSLNLFSPQNCHTF